MKRIALEIKALSGLAIGLRKPGGSVSEADDFISGTVIRGAIAAQILRSHKAQHPRSSSNESSTEEVGGDFQALFLSDTPAIFQNAYPATLKYKGEVLQENVGSVSVLPATAVSSKNKSGFCRKDENRRCTGEGNGVFDTLIDRFCAEAYGYPCEPNCPKDRGRVDAYTGFYAIHEGEYYKLSADKRLLTRVGINRRRATAEEQILYSIEILNESQEKKQTPAIYTSAILVSNDQIAKDLYEFINKHHQDFRLGGAASRGLGKVEIKAQELTEVQLSIKKRIEEFNNELINRWQFWRQVFGNPKDELEDRLFFTIDLQADTILTEHWQRTIVISEAMLAQYLNLEDVKENSLELHAAYSSYSYRSGWNSAWGLMKDVELVTNRGAVYLLSIDKTKVSEDKEDAWIEALTNLEMKGVGDRTCEGFGQVRVCDKFHLVFREDAV
ncbi:MAG: CRISPR-associated RAMP protein Csx10 [Acaryochloris sp. RU_4_1]|nr:CRISPR-associated RAMP protein Csx10 [Leptolyngbyaceae cyanobacterium SU_3_3]NJM65375.1 CRISPR-associated RAMP protein Csx10 [Acaryochloris sp. RU_4_1]NJR54087.1 CRISPR-associated RAMP protein Csx10 [Acaryochloris sp. CRU_2_0]